MKILVTGANGFVGRNLCATLNNIREGKDKSRSFKIEKVYQYGRESKLDQLQEYCQDADFVFHLAGVNRPKDTTEFMIGNFDTSVTLLDMLKQEENTCPVMMASSIQASLSGRFVNSEYGKSKLASENLLLSYANETGAKVLIYRFPNLFGKWCRPNYNSVVATFCYNIAHDLPIRMDNPNMELTLLYIDDLIEGMLDALEGREQHCEYSDISVLPNETGKFCYIPKCHTVKLSELEKLLLQFHEQPNTLMMPEIPTGSFAKKLFSTYLSYLPKEKALAPLKMNVDERGSFTELVKTMSGGQFSVNISKPGIKKGEHWHHSKWEIFIVVSGHGLIQERRIGSDEIFEYEVSGEKIQAVYMLPGYTHNIINLSKTDDLVTLMWANELFDQKHPDTFRELIRREEN